MDAIEWRNAEKKIDPDFAGSIWELLGHDNLICPTCEAHLRKGICLNACHLGTAGKERFNQAVAGRMDK